VVGTDRWRAVRTSRAVEHACIGSDDCFARDTGDTSGYRSAVGNYEGGARHKSELFRVMRPGLGSEAGGRAICSRDNCALIGLINPPLPPGAGGGEYLQRGTFPARARCLAPETF